MDVDWDVTARARRVAHRASDILIAAGTPLVRPSLERQRVLLLGTGRGGTTAMMQMLCAGLQAAPIFEPLRPQSSPAAARVVPSHGYPYLRPGERDEALSKYLHAVLDARRLSRWSTAQTSLREIRQSRSLVLKEVRANRIAGWLQTEFPDTPIRIIIRHPLDVVESMLRGGRGWGGMTHSDLVGPAAEALGCKATDICNESDGVALSLFAVWLADTRCVLNDFSPRRIDRVMLYEDFRAAPERAVHNAVGDLRGFSVSEALASLRSPSATASLDFKSGAPPAGPGSSLPATTLNHVRTLMKDFEIDIYDVGERQPILRPHLDS